MTSTSKLVELNVRRAAWADQAPAVLDPVKHKTQQPKQSTNQQTVPEQTTKGNSDEKSDS